MIGRGPGSYRGHRHWTGTQHKDSFTGFVTETGVFFTAISHAPPTMGSITGHGRHQRGTGKWRGSGRDQAGVSTSAAAQGAYRDRFTGIARDRALHTSPLSIGVAVCVCLSAAISALFLVVPLVSRHGASPYPYYTACCLASIGLVGVAAGGMIIWSDRHKGRWGWVGLALSLFYLGASVAPQVFLVTAHYHGPVVLALISLAVWNILKRRPEGNT